MEMLTVVMGFILRLGIPLALTAGVVWWLRKLDLRWQLEADQARRVRRKLKPSVFTPLCWETRGCPPERRANCPAYARPDIPCWQMFRDSDRHLREACLECAVFQKWPMPVVAQN
jgi:hypothetical protein